VADNKEHSARSWWFFPTSLSTADAIFKDTMTLSSGDTGLIVLNASEGTAGSDPNTVCGSETATLVSQIVVDGTVQKSDVTAMPASGGFGHLVFIQYLAKALSTGAHTVELWLATNFGTGNGSVTAGGTQGDSSFAIIRY
jgi:hypothetical protein